MKKLILNIVLWIFSLSLLAIIFEALFTYSNYNLTPRNPVSWLMSLDSKRTYDYAVLGSSRTLYHLNPNQIEKLTHKRGINFGLQDAKPFDIKLFVIQLIKKNITKNIYIQIDDSWNYTDAGEKSTVHWLPFINEENIWNEFKKLKDKKYYYYKNIPFYKYANFDSEIGIRDYIKGIAKQPLSTIEANGYLTLYGELPKNKRNSKYSIKIKDTLNVHISEILALCKKNDVKVIFFTSPIYNAIGNHLLLNNYLPNYYDYTDLISEPQYFVDPRHLNAEGTKIFNDSLSKIFN